MRLDIGHRGQAAVPHPAEVIPILVGIDAQHWFVGASALKHAPSVGVHIGITPGKRRVGDIPAMRSTHHFETDPARNRVGRNP